MTNTAWCHVYLESQILKDKEGESQTVLGRMKIREKVNDKKLNVFWKASLQHRALDYFSKSQGYYFQRCGA